MTKVTWAKNNFEFLKTFKMAADLNKLPAEKNILNRDGRQMDDNAHSLEGRDSSGNPVQCHYESY